MALFSANEIRTFNCKVVWGIIFLTSRTNSIGVKKICAKNYYTVVQYLDLLYSIHSGIFKIPTANLILANIGIHENNSM